MKTKAKPRCRVCKCPLTLLRDASARLGRESRDLCARCCEGVKPIEVVVKTERVRVPVSKPVRLAPARPQGRDEDEQAKVSELARAWEARLKGSRA